jgi:CheY-like chemotaxis protein
MSIPDNTNRPILLAEDEESDAMLFGLALKRANLTHPIVVARDGQEAVDYLSGIPPFSDREANPLPSLLVLDLKMPRMTGFEVLAWLATRPDLNQIPAVVLSSSSYQVDIQKATQLGAREFLIKPHTVDQLANVLEATVKRWIAASSPQAVNQR